MTEKTGGSGKTGVCAGRFPKPGDVILQCGYAALEATAVLADRASGKLEERFSGMTVRRMARFSENLAPEARRTAAEAGRAGALLLREAGEGGIFAALWALWKETGLGFDLRMGGIAFLQETIEFLDALDIDPYKARSEGCFLAVFRPEDAGEAERKLLNAGVPVHRLGVLRPDKNKYLRHGDRIRCLDRPAPDTLDQYLKGTAAGEKHGL